MKTSTLSGRAAADTRRHLHVVSSAVVVRELRREYDGREVVRGISLHVRAGEIFGLVGPNGAGKTTLLSMISTRLRPTSGDAWVFGEHVVRDVDAARRLLNVTPQEEALYPTLTATENLDFLAELYGLPRAERRRAVAEALELVGLTAHENDRGEVCTRGMRQRLNLACALVTRPRLLLLDEPTVDVDQISRVAIFDAICALRARGATLLYTTHYRDEAEHLCDRIAIMGEGRLIASGRSPSCSRSRA